MECDRGILEKLSEFFVLEELLETWQHFPTLPLPYVLARHFHWLDYRWVNDYATVLDVDQPPCVTYRFTFFP